MKKIPDSKINISHLTWNILKYTTTLHIMWSYDSLYTIHLKQKNFEKALEYYKLKQETNLELSEEDTKNLIAVLEAESENEKTAKQIAMLERDKQINELKAVQSRNFNIGLIAVFVILLIVGILFIRQNKLKIEHKSTLLEQKLLRLQMNPHFIFNALSSIHSLMNPKDIKRASEYLGNFSRLLRSSLESSREDYILLEEEISSIKNYLELQQLRYENKFDYNIDVDEEIDKEGAIIPPMLIQPFIENAIEHGIRHKEDKGNIYIRFKLDNKKVSCEIEDDGVGREKAWEVEYEKKGKHKSLATEIIMDRINILNRKLKQKISLSITDLKSDANEAVGTMVRLDLPYLLD
jgi:LytS/YehU family sensor histidine kinase